VRARLFAKTGEIAGASFEIANEATIGRTSDNPVILPHALVSGRHARIRFDPEEGCYILEDLGSRNGTFLAGARVREPEKLERLDVINFAGVFDLIFQVLGEEPAAVPVAASVAPAASMAGHTLADRDAVPLPPGLAATGATGATGGTLHEQPGDWVLPGAAPVATPVAPPVPSFALRVMREGGTDTYDLPPGEHLLGRTEECDITIDDRSLSRRHARLLVSADGVSVADLGSMNHTYVEEREILPETPTAVAPGTGLRFGTIQATLVLRQPEAGR
jgi:pSer/pThr/pTyr-binding forkhead associated (FHA) protein